MSKQVLTFVFAAVLLMCAGVAPVAAENLISKVDNFIFLLDSSGSMGWKYKESDSTKIALAKDILAQLNRDIPELGYVSSLNTLAPLKSYMTPAVYNTVSYGRAIDTIPTDILTWGFMGNPTPLGEGLAAMSPLLNSMSNSKALILVSDGGSNRGEEPVEAARLLYEKHHPDLCIHVISLADTPQGEQLLAEIAALHSCSAQTTYEALQNEENRRNFVQQVFYTVVADSDHDGVPDVDDNCPDTPQGVVVNELGCPLDSDGDGVYDYQDECPDTPQGVEVDGVGCPLDTDGDGVFDYQDICPDTPADFSVDAKGCPMPISIDLGLEFDLNKADIKPRYHQKLEEVAQFLLNHSGVTAVVEGHTDSQGSATYNKQLSQKRAQSVVTYLQKQFGVDPSIVGAHGYGEERPIADNGTPEGQQRNRRVLVIISGAYQAR